MRNKLLTLYTSFLLLPSVVFAEATPNNQWGLNSSMDSIRPPEQDGNIDAASVYGLAKDNSIGEKVATKANTMIATGNWFFVIGYIVLVGVVVYSGIEMAQSMGNSKKKEKAQNRLKNALIAFALLGGVHILIGMAYGFFSI